MSDKTQIHIRRVSGAIYLRRDDVIQLLREYARDWTAGSSTEITLVCSDVVRGIADQLSLLDTVAMP